MHNVILKPIMLSKILNNQHTIVGAFIDLDGTITDDSKRKKFAEKQLFELYQNLCLTDLLKHTVIENIMQMNYDFLWILSGRNADFLVHTLSMLPIDFSNKVVGAVMRGYNDLDPNKVLKEKGMEFFSEYMKCFEKDNNDITVLMDIWDDNEDVIKNISRDKIKKNNHVGFKIELVYRFLVSGNESFVYKD